MSKISDAVAEIVRPHIEQEGCSLWDVEYVKEAGSWYLRVYIDKDGGVSIDDCERISRRLDPVLDEEDPIPDSYVFEVGSPGIERELKRPSDFERYLGSEISVKLFRAINGSKNLVGVLEGYEGGNVTIAVGGTTTVLPKDAVAQVKLHVTF